MVPQLFFTDLVGYADILVFDRAELEQQSPAFLLPMSHFSPLLNSVPAVCGIGTLLLCLVQERVQETGP
jgi:hypothetical protein